MATRLVDPASNSLLVLYDDAQAIYQKQRRGFTLAGAGIEARGRTSVLRLNYRNTAQVLALAVRCAQSLLAGSGNDADPAPLQPSPAGRTGAPPLLIEARDEHEEAELIAGRIAAAQRDGQSAGTIAVLCRTKALLNPIEQAPGGCAS